MKNCFSSNSKHPFITSLKKQQKASYIQPALAALLVIKPEPVRPDHLPLTSLNSQTLQRGRIWPKLRGGRKGKQGDVVVFQTAASPCSMAGLSPASHQASRLLASAVRRRPAHPDHTHTRSPGTRGPSPEQSGLRRASPLPTAWLFLSARARTEHHAGENRVLALPKAAGSLDVRAKGEAQHGPQELHCTSILEETHPSTSSAAP